MWLKPELQHKCYVQERDGALSLLGMDYQITKQVSKRLSNIFMNYEDIILCFTECNL